MAIVWSREIRYQKPQSTPVTKSRLGLLSTSPLQYGVYPYLFQKATDNEFTRSPWHALQSSFYNQSSNCKLVDLYFFLTYRPEARSCYINRWIPASSFPIGSTGDSPFCNVSFRSRDALDTILSGDQLAFNELVTCPENDCYLLFEALEAIVVFKKTRYLSFGTTAPLHISSMKGAASCHFRAGHGYVDPYIIFTQQELA